MQLLRCRRSIRKFTEQKIEAEKVELLKEAALRSPSSRNFNPWRFWFVEDRGVINKLANCKEHGSAFMAGASLVVVVTADEGESDAWIEDCSIASILLQLTAQSLGLGSCWVQVRMRKTSDGLNSEVYVRDALKIAENIRIESIIAIGYPAEQKEGVTINELQFEKIKTIP